MLDAVLFLWEHFARFVLAVEVGSGRVMYLAVFLQPAGTGISLGTSRSRALVGLIPMGLLMQRRV